MPEKTYAISMTQDGAILGSSSSKQFTELDLSAPLLDFTLYDLVEHEVPAVTDPDNIPEDYGKELLTVEERIVKAYTYYCDLDADADWDDTIFWDGQSHTNAEKEACLNARNKTGDGSQENPWKNLTYALEKIKCLIDNTCSEYFRIVCSGTAHYTICLYTSNSGYPEYTPFSGDSRLIIHNASIDISNNINNTYAFYQNQNIEFYNCNVVINYATAGQYVSAFAGSHNSTFYTCDVTINFTYTEIITGARIEGFSFCYNSIFINCNTRFINEAEFSLSGYLYLYSNCSSNFYMCYNFIKNTDSISFYYCQGIFYECNVKANKYLNDEYESNFFYNCNSSKIYKPIIETEYKCDDYPIIYIGVDGEYVDVYSPVIKTKNNCPAFVSISITQGLLTNPRIEELNSKKSIFKFSLSESKGYNLVSTCNITSNNFGQYANGDFWLNYYFMSCNNSNLYNCKLNVIAQVNENKRCDIYGFSGTNNSYYNCEANIKIESLTQSHWASAVCFNGNNNIFNDCIAISTSESNSAYTHACGFINCSYSTFNNCNSTQSIKSIVSQTYMYPQSCYTGNESNFNNCNFSYSGILNSVSNISNLSIVCINGNENLFNNVSYFLSATATSVPDESGNFTEIEKECGIYNNGICEAGYRCEQRTQDGTTSC